MKVEALREEKAEGNPAPLWESKSEQARKAEEAKRAEDEGRTEVGPPDAPPEQDGR